MQESHTHSRHTAARTQQSRHFPEQTGMASPVYDTNIPYNSPAIPSKNIFISNFFSNVLFSSSYISDLLCQLIQLVLHQCICNNFKSKNLENQIQNTAVA